MSASAMSAQIRAKKKKMEEDESGAVKLSGIPEDANDILINENHIEGEKLSENVPMEHSEEPSDDDKQKLAKAAKMRALMMKMSK